MYSAVLDNIRKHSDNQGRKLILDPWGKRIDWNYKMIWASDTTRGMKEEIASLFLITGVALIVWNEY